MRTQISTGPVALTTLPLVARCGGVAVKLKKKLPAASIVNTKNEERMKMMNWIL